MAEGAVLLRGFARPRESELTTALRAIEAQAPFRHMQTPGGHAMSVAMTNCGAFGWATDRSGYNYVLNDPLSGQPRPAMPAVFHDLPPHAAHRPAFPPFPPLPPP